MAWECGANAVRAGLEEEAMPGTRHAHGTCAPSFVGTRREGRRPAAGVSSSRRQRGTRASRERISASGRVSRGQGCPTGFIQTVRSPSAAAPAMSRTGSSPTCTTVSGEAPAAFSANSKMAQSGLAAPASAGVTTKSKWCPMPMWWTSALPLVIAPIEYRSPSLPRTRETSSKRVTALRCSQNTRNPAAARSVPYPHSSSRDRSHDRRARVRSWRISGMEA